MYLIENKEKNNFKKNLEWSVAMSNKILQPGFYKYVFESCTPIIEFEDFSKGEDLQKQGIDIVANASKLCPWAAQGKSIFIDEKIQRPPLQFENWDSFAFDTTNFSPLNKIGWANKEFKPGQFLLFGYLNQDENSMNTFILDSCIIKDILKAKNWDKKKHKNGQHELTLVPHSFVLENYPKSVFHYYVWETGFMPVKQKDLF